MCYDTQVSITRPSWHSCSLTNKVMVLMLSLQLNVGRSASLNFLNV